MIKLTTTAATQLLEKLVAAAKQPHHALYVIPTAYPHLRRQAYGCIPGANYTPGDVLEWNQLNTMDYEPLVLKREHFASCNFTIVDGTKLAFTFKGKEYHLCLEYAPPATYVNLGDYLRISCEPY